MNLDHLEALLAKANKGMDKLDYIAIASAAPELLAAARERDRLREALDMIACGSYPGASHIAYKALNPEPKP